MVKTIGILAVVIAVAFGAIKYFDIDVGAAFDKAKRTLLGMNDSTQKDSDGPKDTCWQDGDGKKYYTTGDKPGYGKTYVPCED